MRDSVRVEKFASHNGEDVLQAHLVSAAGVEVDILNYGCLIRDWRVPVAGEGLRPVVLGFDSFQPYADNTGPYFGAVVGRVANRIGRSEFSLEGVKYHLDANDGKNHLHGGLKSLSHQIWQMEVDETTNSVTLTCHSPDGDQNYPGAVDFTVVYRLDGTQLTLEMTGVPDRNTPINMTQHNYFNLDGGGDVQAHNFKIASQARTELQADLIPTGKIVDVSGTDHDFSQGKTIIGADGQPMFCDGNYVLHGNRDLSEPVADVLGGDGKVGFKIYTDQPGLQFYNSPDMNIGIDGLSGRHYGRYAGFCLEDQFFPDAVNHSNFLNIIYGPERHYSHSCRIDIAAAKMA